MTRWNPNDPSVVGPEFLAGTDSADTVYGLADVVVQRFRSNSTEAIAAARIHTAVNYVAPATYLLEILAAGDEVDDAAFTTVTYAPNVLTGTSARVTNLAGGAAVVTDIDEWPPVYTDGIKIEANTSLSFDARMDLEFGSAGLAPTGRIAAVAVEVVTIWGAFGYGPHSEPWRRVDVSLVNGGTLHGTQTRIIPQNNADGTAGRYLFTWGEINPITGLPWTAADVQAFDTATTRVRIARSAGDLGTWATPAVRLVVAYENTERRLAVGAYVPSAPVAGPPAAAWTSDVTLRAPDATPGWAKANATDYAFVIRMADLGGSIGFGSPLNLTTLQAAGDENAPADLGNYYGTSTRVTVLTDYAVKQDCWVVTAETAVAGRLFAFVLRTTAPATSADGQPYSQVRTPGVSASSGSTQQELTPGASRDYAGLRLTAGWFPAFPTADLVVEVRRRSTSALMGTFTITPDDLVAAGATGIGELVVVETKAPAPGIALSSGVQYYLDVASATPAGNAWLVGLLAVQGGAGGVTYQEATYRGGTDQADPIAGVAATALTYTPADFAAVLDAAVTKPAGFTATADLAPLPDDQPCPLDGIPYVGLGWDVTVLGADFAAYQIERLGADGVTWEQIANITDEAVDAFVDYEARLGVAESYRLRVVRTDGASSYWTDTETATAEAAGCGYTFTSNEAPEMSVGYPDTYKGLPTRVYRFPEADEVSFRRMYGRDYQVAFKPLSRRGVTFERHLVIGGLSAPAAGVGPPAADMIRDLAWATLSYVCVRDQNGNRWFANLRVVDLEATNFLDVTHIHEVNVAVVEVTATPAVVDAAS